MKLKLTLIWIIGLHLIACVEEAALGINPDGVAPDVLIVEATLTNELKRQQVTLTKLDTIVDLEIDSVINAFSPSLPIERNLIKYEENATVFVTTDNGVTFDFEEVSPGIYESRNPFAANSNDDYQLSIRRQDGKSFISDEVGIAGTAEISNIYAEKVVSDLGVEGIGIFVDNTSRSGTVENIRYDYEETYKIIAPNWTRFEFKLTDYDPCALPVPNYNLEIVEREQEERVCYRTDISNTIIQSQVDNDKLERYMVRFIGRDNFIISLRYSILVKQMVTGQASFGFYENLNNFSQLGSVFSQIQPGFLEGNIRNTNGEQNNVIGFFDVVSVSNERLFFDYEDFYPDEPLPPYIFNCDGVFSLPESHVSYCYEGPPIPNPCPESIIERVNLDLISFVDLNFDNAVGSCPGPYTFTPNICGDCTVLGSNVIPEFWIEE